MSEFVCQQDAVEIAPMHARRCRAERDATLEAFHAADKAFRSAKQNYVDAVAALAKALDEEKP